MCEVVDERLFDDETMVEHYQVGRPNPPNRFVNLLSDFYDEKAVQPLESVVDVGCGPGNSVKVIQNVLPHAKIVGVDLSSAQINAANANFKDNADIRFECGDANEYLPGEESSVQLITCVLSIHWLDLDKFYVQCHRILSPGGILAALIHGNPTISVPNNTSAGQVVTEIFMEIWNGVQESTTPNSIDRLIQVGSEYSLLKLPYEETRAWTDKEDLVSHKHMTLHDLSRMVESMGTLQLHLRRNPQSNLRDNFYARCEQLQQTHDLGPKSPIILSVQYAMFATRKPIK